jgi:hypothetical protein
MDDAARTGGGVVQLAGIVPCIRNQLLEAVRRQRGPDAQDVGTGADDADWDKILLRIVVGLITYTIFRTFRIDGFF